MDEVAILEVLRQQLKENVDKLIDDAILRVKRKIDQSTHLPVEKSHTECDDQINLSHIIQLKNSQQSELSQELKKTQKDVIDIISEDSGSLVLDYSPLQNQLASQKITSQTTDQTQLNEDDNQTSQPDTYLIKNQFQSASSIQSRADSLISPVLNQAMRRGLKRHNSNQKQEEEHDFSEQLFSRNLSCTTPIKPKLKKAKQIHIVPRNATPPHFWSLDMPSSPTI